MKSVFLSGPTIKYPNLLKSGYIFFINSIDVKHKIVVDFRGIIFYIEAKRVATKTGIIGQAVEIGQNSKI